MDLKTFGQAIRELAEEKGVAEDKVIETIELAVAAAYKKDYGKKGQIIRARFNPQTGELRFSQIKMAVDDTMIKSEEEIEAEETARLAQRQDAVQDRRPPKKDAEDTAEELAQAADSEELKKVRFNPERHIMLDEARIAKPDAAPGEELEFPLEARSEFGRIASQTAKQVIIQRIREAEREATYAEFKDKEGEIVSGIVQRIEGRNVFIDLGRGVGILTPEEQIPRERYAIGERLKSLLVLVEKDPRGPGMFLSRSHPRFMKKLFELEVPEIPAGNVEIKAVAREPGSRAKIAAASNDPAIDPVGSMVGQRGVRVSTVIQEIGGEKIDIIEWSDDPGRFIANALSPAKVLDVELAAERREARVLVPDDQLSLAIGKGGQNVRLAAKLTGWKIDVRSKASQTPAAIALGRPAGLAAPDDQAEAVTESKPLAEAPETAMTEVEISEKSITEASEMTASEMQSTETPPKEKPKKKRLVKKRTESTVETS